MATTGPLRSFINGKLTRSSASATISNLYNSSTGLKRQSVQPASSDEIQQAVQSASRAQQIWSTHYCPSERGKILRKASEILCSRIDELAEMECIETGRIKREFTSYDIPNASECLNYYAGVVTSQIGGGQYIDMNGVTKNSWAYTRREPVGTTVGIGAWNYPLSNAVWKSAPSLAFGNSMLYKPSQLTPSSALALAEIYKEAGVPDGVFQVLLGAGSVGKELVSHRLVDKVSFTGSIETGRDVYKDSAATFKGVTLELGGKSPLIIMKDADLEKAIEASIVANWSSNGQVCSNGTRLFVHESLLDAFLDGIIQKTKQLKIGDPMNPTIDIGPMISRSHMERVMKFIDIGKNIDKATLLYGGEALAMEGNLSNGYFLSPAIFIDCHDDMTIVQQEVFGMLMSVLKFTDEEEVLARANSTDFGLAAGIFTNDLRCAHYMAAKLKAGTVWINNYNLGPIELPWGGFKHSGVGRENGPSGIETWTTVKSVYVDMNREK